MRILLFISLFILGLLLIGASWKALRFASTKNGKKIFRANDYMDEASIEGLSVINGVAFALILFFVGIVVSGIAIFRIFN